MPDRRVGDGALFAEKFPYADERSNPMTESITTIEIKVPDGWFWYLAGPMTGFAKYNFPEFERVTKILRAAGLIICTPHELEQSMAAYETQMASVKGDEASLASTSSYGLELLRRDANIVLHPRCVGVITLDGWEDSFGAGQVEVYLADRWKKQTQQFVESGSDWALVQFDYNERMGLPAQRVQRKVGNEHPLALEPLGPISRLRSRLGV